VPLIPRQVVDKITSGENALREWRGKTQLYIARKTNIGQGYASAAAALLAERRESR